MRAALPAWLCCALACALSPGRGAIDKAFAPLLPSAYTLTVARGRFAGKKITSLDEACRGLAEPPPECHAETFLKELRDAGELK